MIYTKKQEKKEVLKKLINLVAYFFQKWVNFNCLFFWLDTYVQKKIGWFWKKF